MSSLLFTTIAAASSPPTAHVLSPEATYDLSALGLSLGDEVLVLEKTSGPTPTCRLARHRLHASSALEVDPHWRMAWVHFLGADDASVDWRWAFSGVSLKEGPLDCPVLVPLPDPQKRVQRVGGPDGKGAGLVWQSEPPLALMHPTDSQPGVLPRAWTLDLDRDGKSDVLVHEGYPLGIASIETPRYESLWLSGSGTLVRGARTPHGGSL